uniref:Uncharacterized protein n=1 Tax=Meloidogyne enterolobii TaxID=390850 RepID=A0A6V7TN36_MELEN|nr:unnamed protein product [Meloidogyne enterolobii]
MSESNLQFHDIYWDKNEQGEVMLRKRHVCVNKLIISPSVRLQEEADKSSLTSTFKASFSLFDRRPFAKRQIVSNIFSVQIPVQESGIVAKVFQKSQINSSTILIRSNYRQKEVALQIILEKYSLTSNNVILIGNVELELLGEKGQDLLGNRSFSHLFENGVRLEFKTGNVPTGEVLKTDSLPDVLICDERWIGMLAIYRQLLCESLAKYGNVFADRPSILVDPIIANFTLILDKDQPFAELILKLLQKYGALNKEITPQESVRRFRHVCNQFMLPSLALINSEGWKEKIKKYLNGEIKEEPNPINLLSTEPCKMTKISDFQILLCGIHSLD